MADLFKGVSLVMLLNISFFTASKAFSICGLSSSFVSFQGCIGLSGIKVYRVIYRAFRFRRWIAFWGVLNIRYS